MDKKDFDTLRLVLNHLESCNLVSDRLYDRAVALAKRLNDQVPETTSTVRRIRTHA